MSYERRAHTRVGVAAPVLGARLVAGRAAPPIVGTLLNAGRGGVAFVCDEPLREGDLVELVVRAADGSTRLQKHVRVMGCVDDALHRRLVRCCFVEPLHDLDWLDDVQPQPAGA